MQNVSKGDNRSIDRSMYLYICIDTHHFLPFSLSLGLVVQYGLRPQVRIDDEEDIYADEKDFGRRRRNPVLSFFKFALGLGFIGYAAGSFYEMQRKQMARERLRNRFRMG